MPYNLVKSFNEIVREINDLGYTKMVNFENLEPLVIAKFNTVKTETIKSMIETMQKLGYLKKYSDKTWLVMQEKPHKFIESKLDKPRTLEQDKEEIKKRLDSRYDFS